MMRYETEPPVGQRDGAAYQSWLRRRIANLENLQIRRMMLVDEQKRKMDAKVDAAQREIDNLRAQQTIGSVK